MTLPSIFITARAFAARSYKTILHYLETGDLIPFLVVVSVFHFVGALGKYDLAPVALAVGVAVDVGMYRVIKAALKYGGWWWLAAVAITAVSYGYHVEYYSGAPNALVLAVPIPLLIILLAALSHRERYGEKLARDLAKTETRALPDGNREISNGNAAETTDKPETANAPKPDYQTFKLANLARNGNGPMDAKTAMREFGIPQTTAYRWLRRYEQEMSTHA